MLAYLWDLKKNVSPLKTCLILSQLLQLVR